MICWFLLRKICIAYAQTLIVVIFIVVISFGFSRDSGPSGAFLANIEEQTRTFLKSPRLSKAIEKPLF